MTLTTTTLTRPAPAATQDVFNQDPIPLTGDSDFIDNARRAMSMDSNEAAYDYSIGTDYKRPDEKAAVDSATNQNASVATGDAQKLNYELINPVDEAIKIIKAVPDAIANIFDAIVKAELSLKGILQGAGVTGMLASMTAALAYVETGSLAVAATCFSPPLLAGMACYVLFGYALFRAAEYLHHTYHPNGKSMPEKLRKNSA